MGLTIKPDLLAALEDLSDALGKPTATVAVDLLTEMIPQLHDLAKYARAVKSGKKSAARRALQHMLGDRLAEQMELMSPTKENK